MFYFYISSDEIKICLIKDESELKVKSNDEYFLACNGLWIPNNKNKNCSAVC